jgi:fumarate reductase subunit D
MTSQPTSRPTSQATSQPTPVRVPPRTSQVDLHPPRRRRPPAEPFVWLGFSAGGMIAALLLPVAAFLFAIAVPLGWLSPDFDHLSAVITNPVTIILMIIGFVVLIIHSAHRLRYLLYDGLKIKHKTLVGALCYGGAVVASIIAVILVLMAAF